MKTSKFLFYLGILLMIISFTFITYVYLSRSINNELLFVALDIILFLAGVINVISTKNFSSSHTVTAVDNNLSSHRAVDFAKKVDNSKIWEFVIAKTKLTPEEETELIKKIINSYPWEKIESLRNK